MGMPGHGITWSAGMADAGMAGADRPMLAGRLSW